MDSPFPERFDLGDVVVRRYTHDDVPALARAVRESYDHLHPWMSWATPDGITEEALRGFVDATDANALEGTEAVYGIFPANHVDNKQPPPLFGGCGLHNRLGPRAIEIGYWLHVDATGKGLMTRVAGALTETMLTRGDIDRVEIHCDEANLASAAVPRRLGYTLVGIEPSDRPEGPAGTGRHMIWAIEREGESPVIDS